MATKLMACFYERLDAVLADTVPDDQRPAVISQVIALIKKEIIGKDYTELTLVNLEHDTQRQLLDRRPGSAKTTKR